METKKVTKEASRQPGEPWSYALTSGIVAGGAFLFARIKLGGAGSLIVPGLAMVFLITGGNFRFSFAQKALAIAIMFVIGMFGRDILSQFMKTMT